MNPTDYVKGVLRTECPYGPVLERLRKDPRLLSILAYYLMDGVDVSNEQDVLKKAVFYGKTELLRDCPAFEDKTEQERALQVLESDPRIIRLLHAYIGMMTEAGELQQQLYGVLFEGKELDVVNCQEEGGDGLWYHGIHSDAVGMPLEDMMGQNNAKLRARFPEKFTDKEADIRDLQAERNVLEGVGTVKDCQITAGTIYSMAQTENLE